MSTHKYLLTPSRLEISETPSTNRRRFMTDALGIGAGLIVGSLGAGSRQAFAESAAGEKSSADKQLIVTLNDGNKMPQLGLGAWLFALNSPDETRIALREALACGYRSVDAATVYRNGAAIGEAIQRSGLKREDIFVTAKIWNDEHGLEKAQKAVDQSLKRLGLDYVNLLLIQWPKPEQNLYVETWRAFIKMKKNGLARSIGVANFDEEQLNRIISETGEIPVLNQIRLNPYRQQRELCAAHGKLGIYTQTWNPLARLRTGDDPTIVRIMEKHGRTMAQIIIRWLLQSNIAVISRSPKPARIRENFKVFDFALDDDDMKAIALLDGFV